MLLCRLDLVNRRCRRNHHANYSQNLVLGQLLVYGPNIQLMKLEFCSFLCSFDKICLVPNDDSRNYDLKHLKELFESHFFATAKFNFCLLSCFFFMFRPYLVLDLKISCRFLRQDFCCS